MLIGTWKINVTIAFIAFVIAFFASLSTNLFITSVFRGMISFCIAFVIGYFFRFLWFYASIKTDDS